jgi:hypothetical protein
MAAAAHATGGYDGVPQSVGREFNEADKGRGIIKPKAPKSKPKKRGDGLRRYAKSLDKRFR